MNVIIYDDINNAELKIIWQNLEDESCCFPQSRWKWCSSWWNYLGANRKVQVFVIVNNSGKPVALAPFVIDSIVGIKYLRSLPINYGDFYEFIFSNCADKLTCTNLILKKANNIYNCVLLYNIVYKRDFSNILDNFVPNYLSKVIVKNISTDLKSFTFDDYLNKLSKNRRGKIKKTMTLLENTFNIELNYSLNSERFLEVFPEIVKLQSLRWGKNRPERSQAYLDLMRESLFTYFDEGEMRLLELRANSKLIAYRIGFVRDKTFYDWNTSYDIEYEDYSPGALSIAYLVRELIESGIGSIDFMSGYYDYKISYSPDPQVHENKLYFIRKKTITSSFLLWYFFKGRDLLKNFYISLMNFEFYKK